MGEREGSTVLTCCPPDPPPLAQERRTQLFSATMTSKVAKLQRACLRDPVKVEVRGGAQQRGLGLGAGRQARRAGEHNNNLRQEVPLLACPPPLPPPLAPRTARWPPSTPPWRRCASSTCLCPPSTRTATSPSCSRVGGGRVGGHGAGAKSLRAELHGHTNSWRQRHADCPPHNAAAPLLLSPG